MFPIKHTSDQARSRRKIAVQNTLKCSVSVHVQSSMDLQSFFSTEDTALCSANETDRFQQHVIKISSVNIAKDGYFVILSLVSYHGQELTMSWNGRL